MNYDKTKPSVDDRKKFDIDLSLGELQESEFYNLFNDSKIELKTERWKAWKSGNIAVEFECYGKPSGISATEADYWVQTLLFPFEDKNGNEQVFTRLIFKVNVLKALIARNKYRVVRGGDNKASGMYLIPLNDLFDIKMLKGIVDEVSNARQHKNL